jgi:hypothetical protein
MNQPTRRIVETLVLAATAVLLLGHGGDVPTCFAHAVASRTFNVVGTCGPAGVVTVTTGPCSITLTGDNVGLPMSGNLGGTLDDGFQLYGMVDRDWNLECSAAPTSRADAGVQPPAGAFALDCRRRLAYYDPGIATDPVNWCLAELWPVTPTCDIHACAAVTCSSSEHAVFSASGCCPVCVANGPNDVIPVPPPPLCHPDTCPQSCPAGQELFTPANACCGTCETVSQACLDGRVQWVTEVEARWSSARACAQDADCTITAVGSRCGATTCNDAVAADQLSTLVRWAGARGEELCPDCTTEAPSCSTNQPARPVCSNSTCVLTAL